MKIVVIGGSGASTPEFAEALVEWPAGNARRPRLDVVLQGRSEEKLRLVHGAFERRLGEAPGIAVRAETDLVRGLEGADVVLMQVRVGGYDARAFDETFPRAYGIPGEETQGPGGFADALRTIPALRPYWRAIESHAPQALVVNLTNPSGIVTTAMRRAVPIPVVSICDAPVTFTDGLARLLDRPAEVTRAAYVGMNHAGFFVDPDPEVLRAGLAATSGIDVDDVVRLGALPTPYLRFYLHPDRQLAAQVGARESRAQQLKRLEAEMLGQYANGASPEEQSRRGALWYRISVVPLLDAIANGQGAESMILGLPNAGEVTWAPLDAIVEGPGRLATDTTAADDAGIAFVRDPLVGLPDAAAAMLRGHAAYELATAAALDGVERREDLPGRRAGLVAALAQNPMVPSLDVADRIVETILRHAPD